MWERSKNDVVSLYPDPVADNSNITEAMNSTWLLADTHTLTPTLMLESHFGFASRTSLQTSYGNGSDVVTRLGLTGIAATAFPVMSVAGYQGLGRNYYRYWAPIHQFSPDMP